MDFDEVSVTKDMAKQFIQLANERIALGISTPF